MNIRTFALRYLPRFLAILGIALASVSISRVWAEDPSRNVPPLGTKFYTVKNGKVDENTRRGWEVFHRTCYVCHGIDAVGTKVAPDLTERVKNMSATEFTNIVLNRYRIVVPMDEVSVDNNIVWREAMIKEMERHERGEHGELVMPGWEKNFRVRPHLIDIFAYLQARSDGVLGTGEPQLIDAGK
jgi:cytochrome c2